MKGFKHSKNIWQRLLCFYWQVQLLYDTEKLNWFDIIFLGKPMLAIVNLFITLHIHKNSFTNLIFFLGHEY